MFILKRIYIMFPLLIVIINSDNEHTTKGKSQF